MRLYIVSTCLWKIWWPTWCDMFNVTHRYDFVTQKVYRQPSFSVWTRAWTRLVVDTLCGNMSVEPKHRILWDKLYTDTSSHDKICMRTRPCKSKSCVEVRFFHSEYTSQSFAWVKPWVKPMISDMISYVKSSIHTRPPMWKFAPGDVLVSQNSAEKAYFSDKLHIVTSHSWYNL